MKSNKNSSQYLQKLLSLIAKKQKNALQQLFDSEAESMMTLARQSLTNEQSAKKVLLKTFVIIWENADSYSADMGSARGWLYSVLRHQIREYYTENYQTLALALAKEAAFKPLGMREIQEELNPEVNAEETFHYYFEQLTQEQQSSLLTVYLSPDVQAVSATRMGIPLARLSEDVSIGLHHLARSLPHLPRHEEGLVLGEFVLGGMSDSELRQAYEIIDRLEDSTRIILLWEELFTEFIAQLQPCSLEPSTWKSLNDKLKELHHQQKELERQKYDSTYKNSVSVKNKERQEKAAALVKDGKKMPISLRLHFLWRSVMFWQGLGIACLILVLVVLFWPSSSNTLRWIAVLSDRSANPTAGWTIKIKDNNQALITPSYQQIGQSNVDLKLWSSKDKGKTMQVITTLDATTDNTIDLSAWGDIQSQQIFYISLEPKGASSSNRPSGSILYQGPVVNLNEE